MRRCILLLSLVFFWLHTLCAEASGGSIEIIEHEAVEFEFTYVKVADIKNNHYTLTEPFRACDIELDKLEKSVDVKRAISCLQEVEDVEKSIVITKNGQAKITGLEQGVYLIEGVSKESYEVSASLVTIPAWNEEDGEMSASITVTPKIQKKAEVVQTGDSKEILPLAVLCMMSLMVVIGGSVTAYIRK